MSNPSRKLITVFGATGAQGDSVVLSLLLNFRVRAITRNAASDAAVALSAVGAEVFEANGFDGAAMEKAFSGSWGAFLNTNTEELSLNNGKREVELGEIVLKAARNAGVEVVVHSTYPEGAGVAGKSKSKINQLAKSMGFVHVLSIIPAPYMENLYYPMDFGNGYYPFGGFPSIPEADGVIELRYPSVNGEKESGLPMISINDDFGDIVHGLFLKPEEYDGKTVLAIGDVVQYDELVAQFTEVTGKKARYVDLPLEDAPKELVFTAELAKLWKYARDNRGRFFGVERELDTARALKRLVCESIGEEAKGLKTWKEWVKENLVK